MAQRFCYCALLLALSRMGMALDPHRPLNQYGHQVWQTDSGLPQNTIHSILQTRDGYLWLGTEGGLVRFDGVGFAIFDTGNTPQLPSDLIYDLFEDRSGVLWISTASGLARYKDGAFESYGTASGLPTDSVWFCYQDGRARIWAITTDGPAFLAGGRFHAVPQAQAAAPQNRHALAEENGRTLWLGSDNGVFALDIQASTPSVRFHLLPGAAVGALALDGRGGLWIGTHQGLDRYSQGGLTPVSAGKALSGTEVTTLLPDPTGGLWVGTANGLSHWLGGAGAPAEIIEGLPSQRVEDLFRDREGALWIATSRGTARLEGKIMQTFPRASRLADDSVLAIFEDREGDLWLGTDSGGLHVLRDQKFITYTSADGLSGDLIRCVFQDAAGDIWIGTNGAGLNRRTASGFATLTTGDGLSSNVILSLAGGSDGSLWIGTPDGLNRLYRGHIQQFTSADGLPDDFIRSLHTDGDGSLWIGTQHGLAHMAGGKFTPYSSMDGLGSDFIGAIFRARSGGAPEDLWIGTSGGLTRLRNGRFANFTQKDGLSNNVVTAIAQDAGGDLWLATNGGGLDRLRNGSIQAFPFGANGLPATIYAILEDASGHLWLSSRTGIFRVAIADLDAFANGTTRSIPVTAYGVADGMRIRECSSGGHPAAWKMHDASLWFSTLEGVSSIDPNRLTENSIPPPVVIERFLIDDRDHNLEGDLTVPPGASRLEFHYAGLSFVAPQKVRYRYKLEGFDHHWIDAGTRRAAFYTNLTPGKYRFRVIAANNDGLWNESGASLGFRIKPHFYQTIWFYFILGLATIFVGFLIYRRRVHQMELGWSAVLAERNRLAREIHDTLAQGYVGISVQLELVSRLLNTSEQAARKQLDQTRALVRSSIAEARTSIWRLRSDSLEDLPSRLSRACANATSSSPAKAYLEINGTYHPMPQEIEDELLRIGQEAVVNAVRHADASRINVQLIYEAETVRLRVEDDGRGFASGSAGPAGHFGIQGMRERAEQIDAVFSLESAPGDGTRVSVEVPRTPMRSSRS